MITVAEALEKALALCAPLDHETVALADADGRVLAAPVTAQHDQPPFPSSAMDGYAVQSNDVDTGKSVNVIGESSAGHRFNGTVAAGQAVRIFTGAPVPPGADRIVIQEDVSRDGDRITFGENLDEKHYIRPQGTDFAKGTSVNAGQVLNPPLVSLIASMNVPVVTVMRKPVVALLSTGDELVMPGQQLGDGQIVASNPFGLTGIVRRAGAQPRILPIARDNALALETAFELASDADLIVTTGGASVGDHDLVGPVAQKLGMDQAFYKVAMRPGKPLMAGTIGKSALLGLPGNPVSSIVCAHLFMVPMIHRMLGLPDTANERKTATLAKPITSNGPREHYMRAIVRNGEIEAFDRQDSSLLSILSASNALLVRPVRDPARDAGETVEYIPLA